MITPKTQKYYLQKLNEIGFNYTEKLINTSFGNTQIIITKNTDKPPLVLVHGLNSCAPFALNLLSFLEKKYQIFAVDILGQPNKSDFVRLHKKNDAYGKWLSEVITLLKINNITFCGISFGAFPILKSVLIDDKKINEVFLISPAAFVHGSFLKTIFQFLIPLKKYQKNQKNIYLKRCLSAIYKDYDKLTLAYQKEVFLNFDIDFSLTPNFKKSELKKIKVPITIIASKNDFFVPAQKLKKRCHYLINMKNFIILENSKHIPSKTILESIFL